MAARPDTNPVVNLQATIGVSTVFMAAGVALAAATFRPAVPGRARVTSHLLWPAIFFFIAGYAVTVAIPAYIWKHAAPNYTLTNFTSPARTFFVLVTLFPGLSQLLVVVACRVLFFELTGHEVFRPHRVARRVFLGFDIFIIVASLAVLLATAGMGQPCCEGGPQSAGEIIMAGVFDENATFGFQYFLFAEYVVIGIAAAFARKWTRAHGMGIVSANSMLMVLCPLLFLEFILLLIMTVVHFDGDITGSTFLDFYVSIPWRVGQVAIIGVLIWLSSQSLGMDATKTQIPLNPH